ncbi:hypothetical protein MBLNU459_g6118t1 [Dothideomycetes sp. NU459]
MAERYRSARPPTRREVLGPGDSRANVDVSSAKQTAKSSKTNVQPSEPVSQRKQSVVPKGPLRVRSNSPAAPSPNNKRVAAIVSDSQRKSKRDSEISNASTASGSGRKSYVGRWQLGKTIGKGGCSTVRLVRHKDTAQIGAAKIISRKMAETTRAQSLANLTETPDRSLQDLVAAGKAMPPPPPGLLREIAIMKLLSHDNIVQLYDVWENHNELYLIMEYVEGGELFHYIEDRRGLPEAESVYIFRQIVAALLYCHRLHIHHRDLKPENILLNRETIKIKLVDFGMAALQPEGKKLTTACGSPHYAAPEVIRSRPYDGAKADVWSCGVILYVMLTGMTPFNYDQDRNLQVMYQAIAAADYYMPPELSADAKDLLRKIFVPDPKRRISMDEIWEHPLLHKYDQEWGYTGADVKKEAWIGPSPILEDWTVSEEEDIDKEILRNMRTLWHSVPQPVLVKKLLSVEPNQEKYFYAALVKHREENLENYLGGSDAISYSASDYHHTPHDNTDVPPMPMEKQQSQSQYSIMNDEHLRSSRTFAEPPPSASSYDPYRPSRYRMTNNGANYTKVTVHRRGESNGTRKGHMQHSLRHPNALRVEALKKGERVQSSSSLAKRAGHRKSMSRSSLQRSVASRQSVVSSVWPSSPPVAVPARSSHKRGVSFTHLRKSSTASGLAAHAAVDTAHYTPELQAKARFSQHILSSPTPEAYQSPSVRAESTVRSRKDKSVTPAPKSRPRKNSTPGQRGDIRNASSELEKACEEAFFRSSISSSVYTSNTDKPSGYDTPPSSVSNREYVQSNNESAAYRPLPALPSDTPNTFIARTLEETRNKLAARSATEGVNNSAKFEEVLATLDKIMPGTAGAVDRRITSAPDNKSVDNRGFLPIISEEGRNDAPHARPDGTGQRFRSVTAPTSKESAQATEPKTLRTVPSSDMPLMARKHSQGNESQDQTVSDNTFLSVPSAHPGILRKKSSDSVATLHKTTSHGSASGGDETAAKKKSSWFRRWKEPAQQLSSEDAQDSTRTPPAWEELDDRMTVKTKPAALIRDKQPPHLNLAKTEVPPPKSSSSSEFPLRSNPENKGFSKWFGGKMGWDKKEGNKAGDGKVSPAIISPYDPNYLSNQSYFSTTPPSPLPPTTPKSATEAPTRSWFARFLRLRPETRTVCFTVARARARTELFRLLREWQRHGIKDLVYFPQDNAITARVDKVNTLSMKPVSFRIELFVVLQNGKKAGLSLARCSQTKGAASSFKKVVEVIEQVAREKGLLVEDEEKWKELCEILG